MRRFPSMKDVGSGPRPVLKSIKTKAGRARAGVSVFDGGLGALAPRPPWPREIEACFN